MATEKKGIGAKKRTGASRRVPDYPSMVAAGSVIAIPIHDGQVAFGRVLSVGTGGTMIVEVFRKFGKVEDYDTSVLASGFAVPPFSATVGPILDGRWPVIQKDTEFELCEPELSFEFASGAWPFWHRSNVRQQTVEQDIPPEVAARLLPNGIRIYEDREEQITRALQSGAEWKPGEPVPEWAALVWKAIERAKERG